WLVRIEDVDTTRCLPGMDQIILQQLASLGLVSDATPTYQTQRSALYQAALNQLATQRLAYPCACSRKDIEAAWAAQSTQRPRHGELVYRGTCRNGLHGRPARAWRFLTSNCEHRWPAEAINIDLLATKTEALEADRALLHWHDRRLGAQAQNVELEVGDFVLHRADGLFAYQLAVVVDDADQHITDVVRGADLADNTARQIALQHALALPTPRYLHTPLVLGANGEKLSKQNGAAALDTSQPLMALNSAARTLGLPPHGGPLAQALAAWTAQWGERWVGIDAQRPAR
ncbi:tRNA glutamyl-Q(34) synthetase GluQRS, partial [Rhodoferax sp.]|uniref:tRNA glutamyl-Q(34) synthetase GluQRS n=1 Tax=Rhodoferax sp. TaxID=50421 RepID=UPI00275E8EAF|nr:tRNA glutamyl-Q(34) synthetase GluQRS [Rhodoferax sp.]